MLKKIDNEIKDFTANIKDTKGCDDLLIYMNSDYFSAIKLLMSVSKNFSMYGRLLIFFVITSAGLLMASTIDAIPVSPTLLGALTLFLGIVIILYISHSKNLLRAGIQEARSTIENS